MKRLLTTVIGGLLAIGLLAVTGAYGQTIRTWDGNGTPDSGGNWSAAANWDGPDNIPDTTGESAALPNVSSGTRTVTMDAPYSIDQVQMTQSTAGAVNKLVLGGQLIAVSTTPLSLTPSAGADKLVIDLNGQTLMTSNSASYYVKLNGTVNMGPSSMLDMKLAGNASGMVISNLGVWAQNSSTSRWNWAVASGNNGGIGRRFSNAGTWTLDNNSAFLFTGPTGIGGFGVLTGNRNDGTLKVLNGSTLVFADLTNVGTMELGANAYLSGGGSMYLPNLINASGGVINVTGTGAILGTYYSYYTGNAGSQFTIQPGCSLIVQYTTSGTAIFNNAGSATLNGGNLVFDWNSAANNNLVSKFVNSGTWTLTNGAQVVFTRQGSPYIGGFGVGWGNANSGTINVLDSSVLNFQDLANTGTINLGNAAGTARLGTQGVPTLNNGANGTINVKDNAIFGTTTPSTGITLNNGSASATGASLTVGNGANTPVFTIIGGDARLNSFAGNTVTIAAGATLALKAYDTGLPHPYNSRNAYIDTRGTMTLGGKVQVQPNHAAGNRGIYNYGTFTVSGASATLERLPGTSGYYEATVFQNYAGATLNGTGTLTYINSTPGSINTLQLSNAGTIAPGAPTGTLELVNTAVNNAVGTLAIQLYDATTFDKLKVSGTGAALKLDGSGDTLNVSLVDGKYRWNSRTTFRIYEGGAVTGTFENLLWDGEANDGFYTVTYGSNYIDIAVKAPPSGTLITIR